MAGGSSGRWNDETQSWEDGTPPPVPYTGPMPPRPDFAPTPPPPPPPPQGDLSPQDDPAHPPSRLWTRHSTALIAGAAVAVIAIGVGGGWLLWGRDGDPPADAGPQGTQASAPAVAGATSGASDPSSSGSPTPEDSPSGTEVPDGYRLVHDRADFTTVVPRGWKRSEDKHGVFYTASDDRGLVQIFEITGGATAREALEEASRDRSGEPGYEEVSLGPLGAPALGPDATQLVYAYDSDRRGERVKVVDCAFTAADGRMFAVLVLGLAADWPQQEKTQRIALEAFAPTA
ncbi:hypothetical protein [Streptomyces sp. NPDC017993]|uniref:hypothetical protein n=1 Tax=Streptomyces sp. NPDC017993 TaxID=3365027 RepID=UPI003797B756